MVEEPDMNVIVEGLARIPKPPGNSVFYNRAQVINRDISIASIRTFITQHQSALPVDSPKDIHILEALSATGLRSIRYYKEIPGISTILANDVAERAVEAIRRNVEYNDLDTSCIIPNCADAKLLMMQRPSSFQVIDLDPYGTVAPFISAAIESVADGGLICATCTDMRNLAGAMPEACFMHYGSMPLRLKSCNEMALRIVLNSMQRAASSARRVIEPLLSLSIDFYVRMFVRVRNSSSGSHLSALRTSMVVECTGCGHVQLLPLGKEVIKGQARKCIPANLPDIGKKCEFCESTHRIGGPIYSGRLHDREFVEGVLNQIDQPNTHFKYADKMKGILSAAFDELEDVPLFYELPSLCHVLKCTTPPLPRFKSALVHAGFEVSSSHCDPSAIKTNAPMNVIWDVLRHWVKDHPVKGLKEMQAGYRILQQEAKLESVDWSIVEEQKRKPKRFYPNPEENWGPLSRASGRPSKFDKTPQEQLAEKSKHNQNKRKRDRSPSKADADIAHPSDETNE